LNLKDDRAVIKVTVWRSVGGTLKFEPENGQKVLIYGDISVYAKGGNYQLNCRKMVPVGIGPLELAFRQLHDKLTAEGLFEDDRKQPIPAYASKIGVVTSPTGAAVRDIIQIARRRNEAVELVLYPSKVQGDGAEETIKAGIEYFNSRDDIDIIIAGRGGGSLEDLWPFNTELAVRAVAASRIPVISAVGHEVDITLCDLAADLRAPTPSAASELAVWSRKEYLDQVQGLVYQQASLLNSLVRKSRDNLQAILNRPIFLRPMDIVQQRQQSLDNLLRLLAAAGKNSFEKHKNRLSLALSRLDTLSPLKILERGYTVSRRLPGQTLLRSVDDIQPADRMETVMPDGSIVSFVEKITRQKKK
jgi:exodeoxyribonuclease VII large subunit